MIIYKITNQINNKIYIGLTTCSLEYRWSKHVTESKNINNTKHLYKAMRKYGIESFTIEAIDETNDFKKLGELERYYIRKFNSTNPEIGYNLTHGGESNQYDGNPSSKVTVDDVIRIREIYAMGELSLSECWKMYSDKLSYSGFQKIWEGTSWQGIMDWVYSKENIAIHNQQKARLGSNNGNALYSDDEIMAFRKYYVNHTLQETYDRYGEKSNSKVSFRQAIDKTYSYLPIYKKNKKQWILNGEVIDINNYKPVSTISESGE
mgnify:CR=1 FL=1